MAKKQVKQERRRDTFGILSKFAEFVICPANAIERGFYERNLDTDPVFMTADGIECLPQFQTTWNNESGEYDNELEEQCQRRYGYSFSAIKSLWLSRLNNLDYYWHLIKLTKI